MSLRPLLAGSLLASLLPLAASAQLQHAPVHATVPEVEFDYDVSTGTLTRKGFSAQSVPGGSMRGVFPGQQALSIPCFDNTTPPAFYGLILPGEEWVDWGEKSCDATTAVQTLELAYGTTALDPSMGGTGATLEFALYADTIGAQDVLGTEVLRFVLTGLPASDGTGAVAGSAVVNIVADGFAPSAPLLANGKIGWGYGSPDGLTGPILVPFDASASGPDLFGYEGKSIPIDFDDIRFTGTDILPMTGAPLSGANVPIGFDFEFYGNTITEIGLATDGYLTDGGIFDSFPFPICGDNPFYVGPVMSPTGSILFMDQPGSSLTYQTKGVAPCRTFIAQWTNGREMNFCGSTMTYQVKLFESTNAIEFHYGAQAVPACTDGQFFTASIQAASTDALVLACETAGATAPGKAYRITLGPEHDNGTTNEVNRYTSPATDASFLESIIIVDDMGMDLRTASTHLLLLEEDGSCATAASMVVSSLANPTIFSSPNPPILGSTWVGEVNTTIFPNATATSMSIALSANPCETAGACPTAFGDLLVNPFTFVLTVPGVPVGGVAQHPVPLPIDLSFCGEVVFAQAAYLDPTLTPSLRLTNAIDLMLGF